MINVSRPALHKWSKEGIIRAHKLGGKLFYFESEVMEDLKISVCDLWTLIKNFDTTCAIPNIVHFTGKGYSEIAKAVMAKIEKEIAGNK